MKNILVIVLLVLTSVLIVKSARILGVFAFPGRSHYILGNALLKLLAERGHDVTMISPYREENPPKAGSYRDVTLTGLVEKIKKEMEQHDMFDGSDLNALLITAIMPVMLTDLLKDALHQPNVQQLINSDEKFDVVIVEQFINDAHKALASHFEAPLVLFSSIGSSFWVNPLVGNPAPPSYVPDTMTDYTSRMTFSERVMNSLLYVFNELLYNLYVFPKQNAIIRSSIPNGPDIKDVLYNSSIVLLNSHPSINQPVPTVPNMVQIGGFHVKPPKGLPQDLQEFLDSAKHGAIYFSMGSNLQSSKFPREKRDAFLNAFSKLKQKVLWKWEEDVLPGQPSNVRLGKWLPQQDILAHPNVKLFITHGGYLSITETVYHGVPILAIPIYGDQKLNAKLAVNNGFGLMLPFQDISEKTLLTTILELLNDPKYKTNARKRSELFHDRPVSPADAATYWVEYVIRHKGAPHLRVAALDLSWYKYHLLDVIGFLLVASLSLSVVTCFIVKKVYRKICAKNKPTKIKEN